jgi:hypothetical protein
VASSIVLEARRNPKGLGALSEPVLLNGGYAFGELARIHPEKRQIMLDTAALLFLDRNICFRETLGSETFLVFPSLINEAKPQIASIEMIDDVTYRVTGAVENVYPALVVLLGYTNTFRRSRQWRDQAEYEMGPDQVCGFRLVPVRPGEIDLVLCYSVGASASARLLFQGLFEEFLSRRDVRVIRIPAARCESCGLLQERSTIVRRVAGGRLFVICEECGTRVVLAPARELVELPSMERRTVDEENIVVRQRSAFNKALVRVKAEVRDRLRPRPTCFISYAWIEGDGTDADWVEQLANDLSDAGISVILDLWDNREAGSSISRFISRISEVDYVVIVGTPAYRSKYENKVSEAGNIVAAEMDLINVRLTGTEPAKRSVLPIVRSGIRQEVLPPLLSDRVALDFSVQSRYFANLLELIVTMYKISTVPAVRRIRRQLEGTD